MFAAGMLLLYHSLNGFVLLSLLGIPSGGPVRVVCRDAFPDVNHT